MISETPKLPQSHSSIMSATNIFFCVLTTISMSSHLPLRLPSEAPCLSTVASFGASLLWAVKLISVLFCNVLVLICCRFQCLFTFGVLSATRSASQLPLSPYSHISIVIDIKITTRQHRDQCSGSSVLLLAVARHPRFHCYEHLLPHPL